MSDCFVLGAGFTKGFADEAPLVCDFIEKAKALGYFKPDQEHERLYCTIQRYYRTFNMFLCCFVSFVQSALQIQKQLKLASRAPDNGVLFTA